MKKGKRLVASLLALVLSIGLFAGMATPAFAASEQMNVVLYDLPRGGVGTEQWGHPALSLMGGWSRPQMHHWSVFCDGSYNGQIVYCIEPGIPATTGDTYSYRGEDFWDNYPSNLNPTISPTVVKALIGRIMQYGWQGNGNMSRSLDNPTEANEIAAHIATQLLVWETVVGERDGQFNHLWGSGEGKNNVIENIRDDHPLRSQIFANYAEIEAAVRKHSMLPSFFTRSIGTAKSYELKWNGSNYDVTLTDSNGVLGNYRFSSNTPGVEFSVSGNKLTISCATAPSGAVTITAEKVNSQRKGVVVWSDGIIGGGRQDFATYGATVSDPVSGFLNLEIMTGGMKLKKTSEDGKVSGISFTITGNGYSATKQTDANGEIEISDMNPGVYTVTEQASEKYVPQESQKVTIVSGQTATVNFNNTLKRGSLTVTKSSEDGLIEGMTFHLFGTSDSGLAVDEYATTDASGIAVFQNVLIGSGYTLEEIDTPNRYVIPDNQTAAVNWNVVTEQTVTNVLKKFCVAVTKSDSEAKAAQGNGSLAGASYGLYKSGELVDTFTTDANGQFTTGYYVCDDDWTIQEISPSEGYLLNSTSYPIGADPGQYTIELNGTELGVIEQVIKGNIAILKHSDDGSTQIETPESGAEFAIYLKSAGSYDAAKETERDYLVCDENGYAESIQLPYGIYTVHQTAGWDGREMMPDFDVYVAQDGATYRYLINNANFESYIKVIKVDAETGNTIPYAGAAFKILDPDGNPVTMTYTYPSPATIDVFYTNAEGYLVTPETLPYGEGYAIVEVQAPYGYTLNEEPVYFNITPDDATEDGGIAVVEVKRPNIAQKGQIEISKSGEVFAAVTEANGVYLPVYKVMGLPGAVYEITAVEDIYTPDGTLRASAGEVVDTITTDADGKASSKALYLGKYSVKEIAAPEGMVLNEDAHQVELTYAGQEIEITEAAASFYNERQKVSVSLKKVLEQNETFGIGDSGEITAVSFGIFAAEPIAAQDGTAIPADGLIEIISVKEDGEAQFTVDLPFGKYYVKEISTDKHYNLNGEQYPVTFSYVGQDAKLVEIQVNDGKPIENELFYGSIRGVKKSEDGTALGGAVIGLFKADETSFTADTAILTVTSNDDGSFTFEDVLYGTYLVREIEAPEGYVISDTVFDAVIDEDGAAVEIEIVDNQIRGNVQLTKIDKDYPDHKLAGAEFEVYADSNGNKELDSDDALLGLMTELTGGVYQMNDLTYGGYFAKEKTAPEGFILDEKAYYFAIAENEKTVIVENEAGKGFLNAAQTGKIRIEKTSEDKVVAGFSFLVEGTDITGQKYSRVFVTDANGEIHIDGLRIGDYVVSEVSNEASAKYKLPADITVTVHADKTVVAKFYNELKPEVPDNPKTGDDTNMLLWASLAGVSLIGAAAAGYLTFRKKKEDK